MKKHTVLFLLLTFFLVQISFAQYQSVDALETKYEEKFTITSGNPNSNATLPANWLIQNGATTVTQAPATSGTLALGSGIYHFGGSNNTDRALGGHGEDLIILGVPQNYYYAWRFENNSADTINKIHLSYNQELWLDYGAEDGFEVGILRNPSSESVVLQNETIEPVVSFNASKDSPGLDLGDVLALLFGRSGPKQTDNVLTWEIQTTDILPGEKFMLVFTDLNSDNLLLDVLSNNAIALDDVEVTFFNNKWYLNNNASSHARAEWTPYADGNANSSSRPNFTPQEWSDENNERQEFYVSKSIESNSSEDIILPADAEFHIAENIDFTWSNKNAELVTDKVFLENNATFTFNGDKKSDFEFIILGEESTVKFGSQDNDVQIPSGTYHNLTVLSNSKKVKLPAELEVKGEFRYEPSSDKLKNGGIIRFVGSNSVFNQPNYDDELDIDVVIGNGGVLTFSEAPDNEFLMPQLDMQKLDIESGGTMKVKSDQVLNLVGALANDGTFEIADDGVLLQESESAGTGSGVAKLTRNFANPDVVNPDVGKLQYTGSPIIGSTVGPTGSGSDLMAQRVFYAKDGNFNKANFQPIYETGQTTIVPGRGYLLVNVSSNSENAELGATFNGDAFFNGTLNYNIENVFGEVVEDDLDGYHGYSLSNPYPSPISAKEFILENASGGTPLINGSILLYSSALNTADGNIRGTSGGIIVLNATGSSLPPSIATEYEIPDDISDYYITSGQGFLVKSNHPTGGDIVFNNSMRKGADNSDFKSGNSDISYRFWVRLYNSELEDYGLIGFTPDATVAFDNLYDANYQENTTLNVWSEIRNQKYDIQGLPLVEELTDFLPLGFKSNQSGVHHFDIAEKQNWPSNTTIYLFDDRLNLFYDLSQGPYQFDVAPSEVDEEVRDRFFLTFITTATSIDEVVSENGFGLKQSVGSLKVSHDDLESVQLYSTTGQVVGNYSAQGGVANVPTPSKGVYIVRATTTSGNTWAKQVELY